MFVFIEQNFLSDNKAIIRQSENLRVYNISSIIQCGINASVLIPSLYSNGNMIDYEGRDFDIWYSSYILGNDNVFKIFFSMIYDLYSGKDVYCLFAYMDRLYGIIESLLKLIQQRYGLNANLVFGNEDIEMLEECEFNIIGVFNLDIDKQRFISMMSESELSDDMNECNHIMKKYEDNYKYEEVFRNG